MEESKIQGMNLLNLLEEHFFHYFGYGYGKSLIIGNSQLWLLNSNYHLFLWLNSILGQWIKKYPTK